MNIALHQVGKRFQRHRVFKDVDFTFSTPGKYALLGPNGSGKSTLLRVLAGMQRPSVGRIEYTDNSGGIITAAQVYKHISICAPGQELVEEFTLVEFLKFHFSFKPVLPGLTVEKMIEIVGLQAAANKPIYDYSSGMKQRVKLAQAIFADTPVLMLDEPCTNLDENGVQQYRDWMDNFAGDRLVVVASNDPREYYMCRERLSIEDYQ